MQENSKDKILKFIEVDQKKHRHILVIFLILFNLLLLGAIVYLSVNISNWVIAVLELVVLGVVWYMSISLFIRARNDTKYILHTDRIELKSYRFNTTIYLKDVVYVETKTTLLDKIFKSNTNSMIIHTKSLMTNKFVLPFIKEDVIELSQNIMFLADNSRLSDEPLQVEFVEPKNKNLK